MAVSDEFVDYVNKVGLEEVHGEPLRERNCFAAGALTVFLFLGMGDKAPASWVLRPLMGLDPFDFGEDDKEGK